MAGNLAAAFAETTTQALTAFPNTVGQCVALCAAISWRLKEMKVPHKIALGSLSCRGVPAFLYSELSASSISVWGGHAWLEFTESIIGDPSLLRTARAAQPHSNLRRSLDNQGILGRGALLFNELEAQALGLVYERRAYLDESLLEPLIAGLIFMNKRG